MKKLSLIITYAISCFAGASFEFLIGWTLKYASGRFIWIYPDSPLQTTSLIVIPLWGVAGLMFYQLGLTVNSRLKRLRVETPAIVAWRAKHAQKLKLCQPEQDIGKFMKHHGKLLPHYRKSVKAKVPVQEPDEQN